MSETTFTTGMQQYYERVMDDWQPVMQTEHPYAANTTWLRIYTALRRWIADRDLAHGRVLEVGCGTGLLQDLAPHYVGTDLAASSAGYMRQPFAVCSATRLPFPDNSFDGIWTVWVLEHIDRPAEMLDEIRRVVRPGGSVFIAAAYAVDSWIASGIHKRPFRDLTPRERLTRLTLPVRGSKLYKIAAALPRRVRDLVQFVRHPGPTALRYRTLEPNFETYWDYDADACASLDSYSVALYFLSRGDEPLYAGGTVRSLLQRSQAQAYIVRK